MRYTSILNRQGRAGLEFLRSDDGQSLIEVALSMPLMILLMAYSIDFGYFFIAAANISSAARTGAQYSVLGYQASAQAVEPAAGPGTLSTSVASLVLADMTSLLTSSTTTTIQVCSKSNGMSGNIPVCTSYGPTGISYVPATDPEAPRFVLQRVDVTYTVQPPIPMSFFSVSLLPNLKFHRQVSMRALD